MMRKRFRFLLRLRARYNLFALMNIDTFDSSMPSTSANEMLTTEAPDTRRQGRTGVGTVKREGEVGNGRVCVCRVPE